MDDTSISASDTATSTCSFNFENFYDKMKEIMADIGFINKIANTSPYSNPLPVKIIDYCQKKRGIKQEKLDECMLEIRKRARSTINRGAYMNLFLLWESFVQDFFEETFRKLIKQLTDKEQVPIEASEIFEKAKQCEVNRRKAENEEKKEKVSENFEDELANELEKDTTKWKQILKDYCEYRISRCTCKPYFPSEEKKKSKNRVCDISDCFDRLFLCGEGSLMNYSLVNSEDPILFDCIVSSDKYEGEKCPLIINSKEALVAITKLLYGFRCVLSHSHSSPTFESGGALYNFPKEEAEFLKLMPDKSKKAAKQFYEMYRSAKKENENEKKKQSKIPCFPWYCEIVNLYRFICVMVHRLKIVVVEVIKEKYKFDVCKVEECEYEKYDPIYWSD